MSPSGDRRSTLFCMAVYNVAAMQNQVSEGTGVGQSDDGRVLPASNDALWYRGMFDMMPDAILVADHKGRYVDANRAATTLLGYSLAEFRTMHISAVSTLGMEAVTEAHQFLVQEGVWTGRGKLRRKDGALVAVEVRATELVGEAATYYMATFRAVAPET